MLFSARPFASWFSATQLILTKPVLNPASSCHSCNINFLPCSGAVSFLADHTYLLSFSFLFSKTIHYKFSLFNLRFSYRLVAINILPAASASGGVITLMKQGLVLELKASKIAGETTVDLCHSETTLTQKKKNANIMLTFRAHHVSNR